jgi:NAD-dependent SIR2 family protein deacetylase
VRPYAEPAGLTAGLTDLAHRVAAGGVVVLTGAGLSTESGIPDYRGPTGLARRATPMQYQLFVADEAARRRYWARSHLGWRHIAAARPNEGHRAVAELQRCGLVEAVITQNVDGLHQGAGSRDVVELHGGLDRVVCLGCGTRTPRTELDRRLAAANAGWAAEVRATNPDGDVDLDDADVARFRPVDCAACGGLLKPDVVFFGESVPADRVARCYELVARARLLLVLGSSLTVMSGRRFVLRADQVGIPVAIVNAGPTRGDELAAVLVDAPLGTYLAALVESLAVQRLGVESLAGGAP